LNKKTIDLNVLVLSWCSKWMQYE